MALLGKIREKQGIAVTIIAVGLILFMVGSYFLGSTTFSFQKENNSVGTIAGRVVDYQEFQQKLDEMKINYTRQNNGKEPNEYEMQSIVEQVWMQYIQENAYYPEFEKLGLTVTDEEHVDMIQGKNIHPAIQQAFTNQQTNQFDKSVVTNFINRIKNPKSKEEEEQRIMWLNFEKSLPKDRLRVKYENLLKQTAYVTKEEQIRQYHSQSDKAAIKFVNVPFASIVDSTIKVEDSQLKDYLSRNKEKYKIEETASIDYVSFKIKPSALDTAYYNEEMNALKLELRATNDDSSFVGANSDNPNDVAFVNLAQLPAALTKITNKPIVDSVYGPLEDFGTLKLFKVFDIKQDSVWSARASHILIAPENGNKAAALKKCDSLLNLIKKGANFELLASQYNTDGSKQTGGDLGWFSEKGMVKPFSEAISKFNGIGLLPKPVETQFGYHIVKVTAPKTKTLYGVATITRNIVARDITKDSVFNKAGNFQANLKSIDDFNKALETDKELIKMSADRVSKNSKYFNDIQNATEIVRWVFTDAQEGDVSKVFTIDNSYLVAVLKKKKDKGDGTIEDFKEELTSKVRNEQKAKIISEKLASLSGTPEEIAQKYGPEAQSNVANDLTPGNAFVPGLGYDPYLIGRIFGTQAGQISKPIVFESGVALVKVENKNIAAEIADYTQYKMQLLQSQSGRTETDIRECIKEASDIKDNRYKFF